MHRCRHRWQRDCYLRVSTQNEVVAILFAASGGVFFGYYPARRTVLLNPIDTLCYE